METYFIEISYLLASILFILGLKGLSHPETAKRGMHLAEFGMLMAIIGTLLHHEIVTYTWIITGLAIGSVVGLAMGLWVPMKDDSTARIGRGLVKFVWQGPT